MIGDGPAALGDLVRAYAVLRPDEPTAERIARLLGYELTGRRRPTGEGTGIPLSTSEPQLPTISRQPLGQVRDGNIVRPAVDAPPDGSSRTLPWRRYLRPVGQDSQRWDGGTEGLPAAAISSATTRPAEPLLRPSTAARVLEGLVATDAGDGDIDLDLMTVAIAARRTLTVVPRESRPTLLRGVQLLVDASPAMAPYTRDADHVRSVLCAAVGGKQVRRLLFNGTAKNGAGSGSAWTWEPYAPPAPGTPVLAVAELGLGAAPGRPVDELQESWLDLHLLLNRRGSPLTVLTPFHRSRWPRRLAHLDLVYWDRSCTVSTVQRLVRRRLSEGRVRR